MMTMSFKQKVLELHAKARRAAFGHYIRKGFVPPELDEILEATRSPYLFLAKYNPDQPRVPAGSAAGGQWTSGGDGGGDGSLTDAITPVYPVETLLAALSGSSVISAVRSLLGLAARQFTSNAVHDAVQSIQDYLGGPPDRAFPNDAGDMILMRGDKKIRFDINNPGNDDPHFHIQELDGNGNWVDAGDQHRYYFSED